MFYFIYQTVHWDHIKFKHPVYLEQIRIIPKNCSVNLNNGIVRYGYLFIFFCKNC